MAFYANIYGYIALKRGALFPVGTAELAHATAPIFKPCFSSPIDSGAFSFVSFACSVKIDQGEDELWLAPFESVLLNADFAHASATVEHEESSDVMLYSYTKGQRIEKIVSRLMEQVATQTTLPG